MKFIKILGVCTCLLASCICPALSVGAEETQATERIYTLEEVLEMTDEEFISWWGTRVSWESYDSYASYMESKYQDAKNQSHFFSRKGWFTNDEKSNYVANVTENNLKAILGDSIEYSIQSPINTIESTLIYDRIFSIRFPELNEMEFTEENLLYYTKILTCTRQVVKGTAVGQAPLASDDMNVTVEKGNVNLDGVVNLYDVIWIANRLIGVYEFTEGQIMVGDVNDDGACDLYDAIEIAKTLM